MITYNEEELDCDLKLFTMFNSNLSIKRLILKKIDEFRCGIKEIKVGKDTNYIYLPEQKIGELILDSERDLFISCRDIERLVSHSKNIEITCLSHMQNIELPSVVNFILRTFTEKQLSFCFPFLKHFNCYECYGLQFVHIENCKKILLKNSDTLIRSLNIAKCREFTTNINFYPGNLVANKCKKFTFEGMIIDQNFLLQFFEKIFETTLFPKITFDRCFFEKEIRISSPLANLSFKNMKIPKILRMKKNILTKFSACNIEHLILHKCEKLVICSGNKISFIRIKKCNSVVIKNTEIGTLCVDECEKLKLTVVSVEKKFQVNELEKLHSMRCFFNSFIATDAIKFFTTVDIKCNYLCYSDFGCMTFRDSVHNCKGKFFYKGELLSDLGTISGGFMLESKIKRLQRKYFLLWRQ